MANNIVQPIGRKSIVKQSSLELSVMVPQQRKVLIIIILTFLLLYCIAALIMGARMLFTFPLPSVIFIVAFGIGFYFVLRGLFWQLNGKTTLVLRGSIMTVTKKSPIINKTKTYDLNQIGSFDHHDIAVNSGPVAVLQAVGAANRRKLTFAYGYATIQIPGDLDLVEMKELSGLMNDFLLRYKQSQAE